MVTALVSAAAVVVLAGAGYGLYLMTSLTREIRHVEASLRQLNHFSCDVNAFSKQLALVEQANAGLVKMEQYLHYLPDLNNTARLALDQARESNARLVETKQGMDAANVRFVEVARIAARVGGDVGGIQSQVNRAIASVDKVAAEIPPAAEVNKVPRQTVETLNQTSQAVAKVSASVDKFSADFRGALNR